MNVTSADAAGSETVDPFPAEPLPCGCLGSARHVAVLCNPRAPISSRGFQLCPTRDEPDAPQFPNCPAEAVRLCKARGCWACDAISAVEELLRRHVVKLCRHALVRLAKRLVSATMQAAEVPRSDTAPWLGGLDQSSCDAYRKSVAKRPLDFECCMVLDATYMS